MVRALGILFCFASLTLLAQDEVIPHAQDRPPGPPLSPAEAIAKMTVPEGFKVELVASEPDIVNPVAMTFDERGRVWITESLEYPRREPGKGKDRIKILEDTDHDGVADKFTIFAEGLNIPSGIAVGHGGVWVANAPDLLFLRDTDGDDVADESTVIVTGFGRTDTHELPNSLTWGPDGWLYGLNGVFNYSHVRYPESSPHFSEDHKGWEFTCALFRINPRTREFDIFCEGTSNPWGIGIDTNGSFFISACVIDHLWHLVETGYYHRQGGPYPPFTWKIESIVQHKHQKAAYCGLTYFDSPAYPEEYRDKLYMGNIHGGCINSDELTRAGSTYFAKPRPDFLTANDAWFMPVVQKTGPDGSLYILDWYDRYHCYQDANRDPRGIDRLKGRLYRVHYQKTPRTGNFNLAEYSDDRLIDLLGDPNIYFREVAQRLLQERNNQEIAEKLLAVISGDETSLKQRRHATFALVGMDLKGLGIHLTVAERLFQSDDPIVRAFAISTLPRLEGMDLIAKGLSDEDPDVQLQSIIALGQSAEGVGIDEKTIESLARTILARGDDLHMARIAWQALKPIMERSPELAGKFLMAKGVASTPAGRELVIRSLDWLISREKPDGAVIAKSIEALSASDVPVTQAILGNLATRLQTGELAGARRNEVKTHLAPVLAQWIQADASHPIGLDASFVGASWGDPKALPYVETTLKTNGLSVELRAKALRALLASGSESVIPVILQGLESFEDNFRVEVLNALSRLNRPEVAISVLKVYPELPPTIQPRVIELLTGRLEWSESLMGAVSQGKVPASAININQIKKILSFGDEGLATLVKEKWGTIREGRDPRREQVIADMRRLVRSNPGDPHKGIKAFAKVCAQCHKIYGEGQEVGPDVTLNGRSSFEQLLSNVFDPSLVIGSAYQAQTVVTKGGEAFTGLVVEDSPQKIVLKVQGGKLETILKDNIEELKISESSLMPEGVEKQLTPDEIRDLFAFITLDKHPDDKNAKQLSGVREVVERQTDNPEEFSDLLVEVAPGFSLDASGEDGIAVLANFRGRSPVLRTHPLSGNRPAELKRKLKLPDDAKTRLMISAAYDDRNDKPIDWRLVVRVNGDPIYDKLVSSETVKEGWLDLEFDLSKHAGKEIELQVENRSTDWFYEFGYWSRVELRFED